MEGLMDMMVSVRLSVSPYITFYDMQERGQSVSSFSPKGSRTHTGQIIKGDDKYSY
jgi:hypothetical protein